MRLKRVYTGFTLSKICLCKTMSVWISLEQNKTQKQHVVHFIAFTKFSPGHFFLWNIPRVTHSKPWSVTLCLTDPPAPKEAHLCHLVLKTLTSQVFIEPVSCAWGLLSSANIHVVVWQMHYLTTTTLSGGMKNHLSHQQSHPVQSA